MISIGILIFPEAEELDFVGPFEVLSYANKITPDSVKLTLLATNRDPVTAANGLRVIPDQTLQACPQLDILVLPGGKGRLAAMKNPEIIAFIRQQEPRLQFLASVCTGAFLLAAAGFLTGQSATTHHAAFDELAAYGVRVQTAKVVRAGNIVTAGGISSGLEMSFWLLRETLGSELAREAARRIEYSIDWAAL